jgi:hypothetical protein
VSNTGKERWDKADGSESTDGLSSSSLDISPTPFNFPTWLLMKVTSSTSTLLLMIRIVCKNTWALFDWLIWLRWNKMLILLVWLKSRNFVVIKEKRKHVDQKNKYKMNTEDEMQRRGKAVRERRKNDFEQSIS